MNVRSRIASLLLTLLAAVFFLQIVVLGASWIESVNGDLSNNRLVPSSLLLAPGSNKIRGVTVGGDLDYLKINVPVGFVLTHFNLVDFVSGDDLGFIAIQSGSTFTEPPDAPNVANILGWAHFKLPLEDYLPKMGSGGGAIGFTGPLPAGNYTFWIQQLGPVTIGYEFDAVVEAVGTPEPALKCYPFTVTVNLQDQVGTENAGVQPTAKLLCEAALKHSAVPPATKLQWIMYPIASTVLNPGLVQLIDQFGSENVDPGKGNRLLNPAKKCYLGGPCNGDLLTAHFKGYPIVGVINPPPVVVADQFGFETVDPRPARFLLTPVLKNGEGHLDAPHWKCYPITGKINPPAVSLEDQFSKPWVVDPKPATLLCTRAQKIHLTSVTVEDSPEEEEP